MQANKVSGRNDKEVWHRRVGHPCEKALSNVFEIGSKTVARSSDHEFCDICYRAKQTRGVFPQSDNKTDECFALIHCDLWGLYKEPATCCAVYFLTIVDDHSRVVWIYLLLEKRNK